MGQEDASEDGEEDEEEEGCDEEEDETLTTAYVNNHSTREEQLHLLCEKCSESGSVRIASRLYSKWQS